MKRDMDLVRDILKEAAASDGPFDAKALASEAHPFEEIAAHVEMLDEAGYVRAEVTRAWGGVPVAAKIERLTWEGSDFLDAVASDRIWAKVKRKVGGRSATCRPRP